MRFSKCFIDKDTNAFEWIFHENVSSVDSFDIPTSRNIFLLTAEVNALFNKS